jgi:Domain of unknown function (DUF4124)
MNIPFSFYMKSALASLFGLFIMVATLTSISASAAINKCTSSDGKVIFSDQPCLAGQASAAIKETAPAPAIKSKDASEVARHAAKQRLRSAETPECTDMRERLERYTLSNGRSQSQPDFEIMLERFEQKCAQQMRDAIKAENDRNVAESKRVTALSECAAKRRVLDERRPRLASLSADEKKVIALVELEVARDCK